MKDLHLQQGTPEWLEMRRSMICASDAAILMSASPWSTPLELYQRKKKIIPDTPINDAMRRGMELEDRARSWYMTQTGLITIPHVAFHPHHRFMASLDGAVIEEGVIRCAVEIKCPGRKTHRMALDGEIPVYYQWQMLFQMMVTGLTEIDYVSFDGENGVIITMDWDHARIEALVKKSLEFLEYMDSNTPPTPEEDEHIKMEMDLEQRFLVHMYLTALEQQKIFEKQADDLKKKIVDFGDDGNILWCSEGTPILKMTRCNRDGVVDYDKLFSDLGIKKETVDKYRKQQIGYYKLTRADNAKL